MATKQLIVIVVVLTTMAGSLSCGYVYNSVPGILELSAQEVTLTEASEIIGRPIPAPTYLPKGYAIQEVYIYDHHVILLISDKEIEKKLVTHTDAAGTRQRYEFRCRMNMGMSWWEIETPTLETPPPPPPPPPRGIPGKWVNIGGRQGFIFDKGDHNELIWTWTPARGPLGDVNLSLSAGKRVSSKELLKIAESV